MSQKSAIEWTDATWNPVTGCDKVSPGCSHCYAETFAERWRGVPGHHFEKGFDLVLRPERLKEPLSWTKPKRIFVNSMSDLFHKDVPDSFIQAVFTTMANARQHTFQVLTKRAERMRDLLTQWEAAGLTLRSGYGVRLPNVWLGVSVEDQARADQRVPVLLQTPAAVRFLSCEPLLGPVDLTELPVPGTDRDWRFNALTEMDDDHLHNVHEKVDWVIVGGESGPGARPMHPDWARGLRNQCQAKGVPFFFKQWGAYKPLCPLYPKNEAEELEHDEVSFHGFIGDLVDSNGGIYAESDGQPADLRTWVMDRQGKKAAGRVLDGRTWDEFPGVDA